MEKGLTDQPVATLGSGEGLHKGTVAARQRLNQQLRLPGLQALAYFLLRFL